MPIDFDDADLADVIEEAETSPVTEPPVQDSVYSVQEHMDEVEMRLEKAQYYRLLLNGSFFDEVGNTQVADQVESEIREFVRGRMQVLVGVTAPEPVKTALPFSEAEILAIRTLALPEVAEALKALAAKVLKKPEILTAKPPPIKPIPDPGPKKEPTLRKVAVRRPGRPPNPQPASAPPQSAVGRPAKKQFKTVTTPDGQEVKMDITPQARPVGPIQPLPTPRSKAQIEAASAQSAYQQASAALSSLERTLKGK